MNSKNDLHSLEKKVGGIRITCDVLENNLRDLIMDMKFVRERLSGNSIGKIQEILTLSDLKRSFPHDGFSDENSDKHGTDIVATVREKDLEIGKISISVKHHRKWNSHFIRQLEENIENDGSEWGFLVTTVFPSEALNNKIWTAFTSSGRIVLVVKPEFAPVGFYAFRTILIYEYHLRRSLETIMENGIEIG